MLKNIKIEEEIYFLVKVLAKSNRRSISKEIEATFYDPMKVCLATLINNHSDDYITLDNIMLSREDNERNKIDKIMIDWFGLPEINDDGRSWTIR